MHKILQTIDEVLALCERELSQMTDPQATDAMREAMAHIRDARAILQHHGAMLRSG